MPYLSKTRMTQAGEISKQNITTLNFINSGAPSTVYKNSLDIQNKNCPPPKKKYLNICLTIECFKTHIPALQRIGLCTDALFKISSQIYLSQI